MPSAVVSRPLKDVLRMMHAESQSRRSSSRSRHRSCSRQCQMNLRSSTPSLKRKTIQCQDSSEEERGKRKLRKKEDIGYAADKDLEKPTTNDFGRGPGRLNREQYCFAVVPHTPALKLPDNLRAEMPSVPNPEDDRREPRPVVTAPPNKKSPEKKISTPRTVRMPVRPRRAAKKASPTEEKNPN